jgi:hypothetical protein
VRAVARERGPRPPEQVLVERARAGVDVAADHVRERGLDVRRREHDATQDRRLEVRRVAGDARLDPVGVALAQLLRPGAVAGVQLAGGIALRP